MPSFKKISRIGPFYIRHLLSEGGMALIYAAQSKQYAKVALKMSRPVSSVEKQALFNQAIKKEAEFLSKISHPRLVRILSMTIPGARGSSRVVYTARATEFEPRPWYMILELLEGGTLDEFVKKEGPLTVFEATNIAGNIGLGLNYLHNKVYVVHKDLSPKNIVFRRAPRRQQPFDPVIIDFGAIAGVKGKIDVEIGAPFIMAPERIQQTRRQIPPEIEHRIDKRKSDIWSLGILLYYMLTGKFPFNARIRSRLTSQILTDTPPSIRKTNPKVDPLLEEFILLQMMAKDPRNRPSIREVLKFLKPYGSAEAMS